MSFTDEDVDIYLQTAIAAMCRELGVKYLNRSALDFLTQLLRNKLTSIAKGAGDSANKADRQYTNTGDVALSIIAEKEKGEHITNYDFTSLLEFTKKHTWNNTPNIQVRSGENLDQTGIDSNGSLWSMQQMRPDAQRSYQHSHINKANNQTDAVVYDYEFIFPQTSNPPDRLRPRQGEEGHINDKDHPKNVIPPFLPPMHIYEESTHKPNAPSQLAQTIIVQQPIPPQ